MAARVRFYLDENMQVTIAEQLRRRGVEVRTARDLDQLGAEDRNHLECAASLGYVLCTHDADYIDLASAGIEHAGTVLGQQDKHSIGIWVTFLTKIHNERTAEAMHNIIEYVKPSRLYLYLFQSCRCFNIML